MHTIARQARAKGAGIKRARGGDIGVIEVMAISVLLCELRLLFHSHFLKAGKNILVQFADVFTSQYILKTSGLDLQKSGLQLIKTIFLKKCATFKQLYPNTRQ